jgi:hypothetical protein
MQTRSDHMFTAWYKSSYTMHKDDYMYILVLGVVFIVSMAIGLIIGLIWASCL